MFAVVPNLDHVLYQGKPNQVQRANFSVAPAQTDSALIAAQGAGLKVYVVGFDLHAGSTPAAFQFNTKPAGAGSAVSPVYHQVANGQKAVMMPNLAPLFSTNANEGLSVTTGAGAGNSVGTVWFFVAP